MRKKTFAPTGLLVMGLLVALAALGVVYGLWSKNLVINGTVTTGDLNADWDCGWTNDDGLSGAAGTVQGGGCTTAAGGGVVEPAGDTGADPNNFDWPNFVDHDPFIRKDVGECHLTIGDTVPAPNGFGNQVAYVTITNAYPSYECTISMFITNTGSIPFNISGVTLGMPPQSVGNIETSAIINGTLVNLCAPPVAGVQVDPGQEQRINCTVHVTERAAQNICNGVTTLPGGIVTVTENCNISPNRLNTYRFAINVCVAQWNEAATFAECKASPQHEGPPEAFPGPAGQ